MSKAEQLRAMREAQVEGASKKRLTHREVREIASGTEKVPTPSKVAKPKKKAALKKPAPKRKPVALKKASNGGRFKANKVKGRPATDKAYLTNEARKPWEAMGVSRRTWYRHQATGGT